MVEMLRGEGGGGGGGGGGGKLPLPPNETLGALAILATGDMGEGVRWKRGDCFLPPGPPINREM